jgi:hypothetical protein
VPLTPQVIFLAQHDYCTGIKELRANYGLRYVIVERTSPKAAACFDSHQIAPARLVSFDAQMRVFDLRPGSPAIKYRW